MSKEKYFSRNQHFFSAVRPVVRKMLRDVIEAFDKGLEEFEKRVLQIEVNVKINLQIKSRQHNLFCKIISPF